MIHAHRTSTSSPLPPPPLPHFIPTAPFCLHSSFSFPNVATYPRAHEMLSRHRAARLARNQLANSACHEYVRNHAVGLRKDNMGTGGSTAQSTRMSLWIDGGGSPTTNSRISADLTTRTTQGTATHSSDILDPTDRRLTGSQDGCDASTRCRTSSDRCGIA